MYIDLKKIVIIRKQSSKSVLDFIYQYFLLHNRFSITNFIVYIVTRGKVNES
jgi:hypothetical protein